MLQVREVILLMLLLVQSKFATYSKNSLYTLPTIW